MSNHFPFLPPQPATTNLFCVSLDLPVLDILYKQIILTVGFCDWLLWFAITSQAPASCRPCCNVNTPASLPCLCPLHASFFTPFVSWPKHPQLGEMLYLTVLSRSLGLLLRHLVALITIHNYIRLPKCLSLTRASVKVRWARHSSWVPNLRRCQITELPFCPWLPYGLAQCSCQSCL